jgi:hypothetical protein
MKLKKEMIEKIKKNSNLRLQIALALGTGERNVLELAKRNSDNLTKHAAIIVFEKNGYTINDIIDQKS